MLAQFYKYILVNNTDAPIDYDGGGRVGITQEGWIIDPSTGKITYTAIADDDFGFGVGDTIADGVEVISSLVDNTTTKYLGTQVQIEVTHDSGTAAVDTFDLYIAEGNASGDLQTEADGYDSAENGKLRFVGSLNWDETATNGQVIRSPVFNL